MNNYNVTVVTNKGTYNYKNVTGYSEVQARSKAESDIVWATGEEVLHSDVTFVKVVCDKYLLEESEG